MDTKQYGMSQWPKKHVSRHSHAAAAVSDAVTVVTAADVVASLDSNMTDFSGAVPFKSCVMIFNSFRWIQNVWDRTQLLIGINSKNNKYEMWTFFIQ